MYMGLGKRKRKSQAARRRPRKRRRMTVPRGMSLVRSNQKPGFKGHPFGKQFYTKLRYNEAHTFSASGTANFASSYKMNLNSLYDPNETGAGHQPMGFDELMNIYEKYTVVGAKITVCYIGDTTVPSVCGLRLVDGNESSIVDKKKAIENGDSSWSYMTTANGGNNRLILKKNVNIKKFFGLASLVGNENYTKTASAEPQPDDTCVAELWVAPIAAADSHGRTLVDITIEYACVFTEPKDLGLS